MDQQWNYESRETVKHFPLKATQTVVEAESALTGGLRDECRIYYAGANAYIRTAEILGNRINAEGRIHFRVLYAQGDLHKVLPLELDADFVQYLPLPLEYEESAHSDVKVECCVIQTKAHVQNGRIQLRAILQLTGSIRNQCNVNCVTVPNETSLFQCLRETVSTQHIVGEGEIQTTLKDELELSDLLQIQETLLADAYAVVEDVKLVSANTAYVTGSVLIDAYHTSSMPQRPLIVSHHKIPFEQEISFGGKSSPIISAQTAVRDIAVVSSDNGKEEDSEKWMRCEVLLHTNIKTLEEDSLPFLRDAYTISGQAFTCSSQQMNFTKVFVREEAAESGRLTLTLPANAAKSKQPLLAFLNPVLIQKRKSGSKLILEGTMQLQIVYVPEDSDIPVTSEVELPFAAAFATNAVPDDHISLGISEASVQSVTSERMEVKYILHMSAEGEHVHSLTAVTDIETANNVHTKQHTGISLRYVQPQETVWDIGKQFHIPIETHKTDNHLNDDRLPVGSALVICNTIKQEEYT